MGSFLRIFHSVWKRFERGLGLGLGMGGAGRGRGEMNIWIAPSTPFCVGIVWASSLELCYTLTFEFAGFERNALILLGRSFFFMLVPCYGDF